MTTPEPESLYAPSGRLPAKPTTSRSDSGEAHATEQLDHGVVPKAVAAEAASRFRGVQPKLRDLKHYRNEPRVPWHHRA